MNKEELEQYKTLTQEFFKKQYNSIKDLGNRDLRKVIENSNWNFILQIIRHLENEIFILQQENKQLKENNKKIIKMLQEKYDESSIMGIILNFDDLENIKEILKGDSND